MDDTRQFLMAYLPGVPLRWLGADEHGERRVDVFLAEEDGELRPYYVTSLRIDGCFVAEAASQCRHIPYDPALVNAKPPRGAAPSVFVTTWPVHSPDAMQVRFVQCAAVRTVPVVAGHCALFDWDVPWLRTIDCPAPVALLIGGTWQPTVSRSVAATAMDFGQAYAAHHDTRRTSSRWAVDAFFETGLFEDRLRMIEAVLEVPDVSGWCLGCLAAGPVENLIGRELLDLLERDAAMRGRWMPLLRDTHWHNEPPDIRRRLSVLLGLPPEPV